MDPKRKTIRDLAVTLEDDGRIRVRSLSRRVIGRFDAEFLLVLSACARNCLKPGGRIVPAEFSLHAAGLCRAGPELRDVFENRDDGVDLSCLHDEAMRRAVIDEVDPASIASMSALGRWPVTLDIRERPLRTTATLDGPCAAIAGWFDLHLAEGITLSTAPGAGATSWHQVVFPVALPAGRHEIEMTFSFNPEAGRYVQVEFGEPVGRTIGIG